MRGNLPSSAINMSNGMYLALAQGVAAIGQLLGLRLLTSELSPAVFGEINLLLGISALLAAGLVNPTMQAYLRFAPEYALLSKTNCVSIVAVSQLKKLTVVVLPVIATGEVIGLVRESIGFEVVLLLNVLIWTEAVRIFGMAALNANHHQKEYGLWLALDTCFKPVLAWGFCTALGGDIAVALLGYVVAAVLVWALMRTRMPCETTGCPATELAQLGSRFWAYTIPLLPLGLVGWVTGMSDRYIIGSLLSLEDVGFYAAVYAIASKPMLLLGNMIETLLRPSYMDAVAHRNNSLQIKLIIRWVFFIVTFSVGLLVLTSVAHEWIATVFIGAAFRSASGLMPWIMGGYALLLLSHVPVRVLYAHDGTKMVFWVEVCGAVASLLVGILFIRNWGLAGAGYAVACYLGLQLLCATCFAIIRLKANRKTSSA